MGFKSMNSYNDEKYGNFFRLQNDGDFADVIIMYRGTADVMMADTHYIKSNAYSGYVLCCGQNCPACAKGVRVQSKLFVPLYVVGTSDPNGSVNRLQFWDRTIRFQPQLVNDVFRGYPNPSEFIFRITRHGIAGDINTTYDIRAIQANKNPETSYDGICSRLGLTFPDCFNTVCRDVDMFELGSMMSDTASVPTGGGYGNSGYNNNTNYGAVPRGGTASIPSNNAAIPSGNGMIPGTEIPYTGATTPNVPIQTAIPDAAPDPADIPFGNSSVNESVTAGGVSQPVVDPLETNEDIDTTNLNF